MNAVEQVMLSQSISTVAARGAVEKWLLQVQDVMLLSIRDVIEKARDVRIMCLIYVWVAHIVKVYEYVYTILQ